MSRCSGRSARCGFDPRSREGSDQCRRVPRTWIASFDPRSREGSDRPLINAFSISRNRPGSANLQPCRLGPMAAACHPPPFVLIFNGLSQARTSREFLACLGFAPEAARRWAGCRGAPRSRIDTVLHASTMSGRSSFREAELAPFESRIGALKRAATWAAPKQRQRPRVLANAVHLGIFTALTSYRFGSFLTTRGHDRPRVFCMSRSPRRCLRRMRWAGSLLGFR